MPTFYIRTYGCQMNERDSEALGCLLEARGYERVDSEEGADVILFNTCSVRDQAERKVIGKMGLLKRLKRERPGVVLGLVGCMAQNYGRELLAKLPHLDLVVGTDRLHDIPDLIEDVRQGTDGLVAIDSDAGIMTQMSAHEKGRVTAFVTVMRGCNQFCSYCIVPYVRGREVSRSPEEVLEEVRELVAGGTREIVLLGQNITAYGMVEARAAGGNTRSHSPFADLLCAVHEVPGLERIRFTSPHVAFMNDHFVETICTLPKVCKSFHVPVQSGADRILALMRRGYTAAEYLGRIQAIRSRLAAVTFSTDVIVGFPSESEAEFLATRELMAEVGFDMAYIFRYSVRSGTKAAERLPDDVPEEVKMLRNQVLLDDLEKRAAAHNKAYLGRVVEVLVEGRSRRNADRWTGRSDLNKVCVFPPPAGIEVGDVVRMRVRRSTSHTLSGDVLGDGTQ